MIIKRIYVIFKDNTIYSKESLENSKKKVQDFIDGMIGENQTTIYEKFDIQLQCNQ